MGQYPISMIKIDIIDVHGPQDQYGPLIWKGTPTNVRERWGGRHGEGRVKWSSYQPLVSKQSKAKQSTNCTMLHLPQPIFSIMPLLSPTKLSFSLFIYIELICGTLFFFYTTLDIRFVKLTL